MKEFYYVVLGEVRSFLFFKELFIGSGKKKRIPFFTLFFPFSLCGDLTSMFSQGIFLKNQCHFLGAPNVTKKRKNCKKKSKSCLKSDIEYI